MLSENQMPRKLTTKDKPAAKRTSRPGIKVDKVVESSTTSNVRPRQPRLRQTPSRRAQPAAVPVKKERKKKPGPSPVPGSYANLRKQRESLTAEVIERARATGMMPHEWMLAVMRGEQISHFAYDADTQEIIEVIVLPTFADRMEMAKSAAPYFANKMQPTKVGAGGPTDPAKQLGVMEVPLIESMEKWAEMAQASQTLLKKKVTD